ncbi:spore coat protein CotS, partial [Bacillus haynesii]|nr:spore coat protein CotS [Bacillus haynesii]
MAKSANEENYKNLRQFIPDADRKMVYVDNVIGSKQILKNKDVKNTVQTNGKEYLILREQNEENPNILNIFGLTVPKKENYNFINIGRLSPEKGQEKLINSF